MKKPMDEPNKILLAALVTFLRANKSNIPINKHIDNTCADSIQGYM